MAEQNKESLKEIFSNIKNQYFNKDVGPKTSQFLIENLPYRATPSFIEHNGKVMSILKFYVRPSSNRKLNFQQVIDFIPVSSVEGVEIHLISKDMLLKGQDKQKIIKKNSNASMGALKEASEHEKEKKTNDVSTEEIRKAKIEDYSEYQNILDSQEPLVIFKWLLLVIGPDEESVDEQIEIINTLLNQNHDGAQWDSLPGEQLEEYSKLFGPLMENIYDHTSTGSNYAGLNFAINAGLSDPNGVPLGRDALSISGTTAFFDFEESTKTQAFIAAPRNSRIPLYSLKDDIQSPSMSSMAAQAAANNIVMAGHRAHHIVLNDFNYFEKGRYYTPDETDQIFKHIDVSKYSINPLEGFGELNDVANVYSRLKKKIVNIFNILLDFKMDINQQGAVENALDQFYRQNRLWSANADKNPENTLIVGITDKEDYPRMDSFINSFIQLEIESQNKGRENRADNFSALQAILKGAVSNHMSILGRPTNIQNCDNLQVYYDFANIESLDIKQIQLLNLLDYIIYTADKGDVILIHGFDSILSHVSNYMINTIQVAQKNGIRFIFAFDSIKSRSNNIGKMNDMFELQSTLYTDLDTDVDWCFIGRVLEGEVVDVKRALNQELGPTIESYLQQKRPDQVLVHRRRGNINNFIQLAPVI